MKLSTPPNIILAVLKAPSPVPDIANLEVSIKDFIEKLLSPRLEAISLEEGITPDSLIGFHRSFMFIVAGRLLRYVTASRRSDGTKKIKNIANILAMIIYIPIAAGKRFILLLSHQFTAGSIEEAITTAVSTTST